jgi:hypothetical protein
MKIRNGFVSNSSSSSFVILLPENFKETIDYDKITGGDEDFPLDDFKRLINDFVKQKGMWTESIYEYDEQDYDFVDIIYELTRSYVVAEVETGSGDGGSYVVLDREKIKKML